MVAGEGIVPWCIPTAYFATYTKHGNEGPASPMTIAPIFSNSFSVPRLMVQELEGCTINWYREISPFIALPPGTNRILLFRFQTGIRNDYLNRNVDFRSRGSGVIRLLLGDFMQEWNQASLSGSGSGGRLRLENGKFIMEPIIFHGVEGHPPMIITGTRADLFRGVMGFYQSTLLVNTEIFADRVPDNQLLSSFNTPIGTGSIFTDTQNPCQTPNPPLSAPDWKSFNYPF
jgi:hypothetical protein